ncbi:pickpocket protein 28-like [Schistocerca nitens]|uniref:pickpocket protein 28-like n=1 Tax=Schistocerca nitens TaxID=7011 RepID=UPI0021199024|nr:pickpocket protein 28-like [Schistocerca nitens]
MGVAETLQMPSFKLQRVPPWQPASPPPPVPWVGCSLVRPPPSPLPSGRLARWGRGAREYCQASTLHGLKYVGDNHLHLAERFFWLLSFLLAVAAATYYITILYQKWDDPVIVTLSPTATPLNVLPFPAVTVCNMNRAKHSIATRIMESQDRDDQSKLEKRLLSTFCDLSETETDVTPNITSSWDAVEKFLVKVGQPCHEMLVVCRYGGETRDCNDLFNPAITDEGICCSFNKVHRNLLFRNPRDLSDLNVTFPGTPVDWTPEGGYPPGTDEGAFPLRPRGRGTQLGLTLLLDSQADEYFCSTTASVGFKMMLQNPVETPKIAHMGFVFSPGEELRVVVSPQILHASQLLRKVAPAKRRCVFSGEAKLHFYRTYTQRNCKLECEANYTLAQCGCVLSYMPKDSKTPICSSIKSEACANKALDKMEISLTQTNDGPEAGPSSERTNCSCLPGCSEISYSSSTFSSRLWVHHLRSEYTANVSNVSHVIENLALVHIFFTESQFTSMLKAELFGFTEFLSNTGGLLGLFMGFSFMSVAEAVYFLTLRLWCVAFRASHGGHGDAGADGRHFEVRPYKKTVAPYPFMK